MIKSMKTTFDSIEYEDLLICQPEKGYRFNEDSVFLSDFVRPKKDARVIDIGSGSGVISALIHRKHELNNIDAVELQKPMFECLLKTVAKNDLGEFIRPMLSDIKDYKPVNPYHIAVCNPPYRKPGTGKQTGDEVEDIARFSHRLVIDDILQFCRSYLENNGSLFICYDADMLVDVFAKSRSYGLEPKRLKLIHPDLDSPARIALIELKKCKGVELLIEPPIIRKKEN